MPDPVEVDFCGSLFPPDPESPVSPDPVPVPDPPPELVVVVLVLVPFGELLGDCDVLLLAVGFDPLSFGETTVEALGAGLDGVEAGSIEAEHPTMTTLARMAAVAMPRR